MYTQSALSLQPCSFTKWHDRQSHVCPTFFQVPMAVCLYPIICQGPRRGRRGWGAGGGGDRCNNTAIHTFKRLLNRHLISIKCLQGTNETEYIMSLAARANEIQHRAWKLQYYNNRHWQTTTAVPAAISTMTATATTTKATKTNDSNNKNSNNDVLKDWNKQIFLLPFIFH